MRKVCRYFALLTCCMLSVLFFAAGCGKKDVRQQYNNRPPVPMDDNYRTYYEIFVGSFSDSNGDGIGDLRGIINRLDYLNDGDPNTFSDLGVTGIWLMPIHPSPSYHKYDVTDYMAVDESYGTMQDFEELVAGCQKRGIKLILDLVVNHTSYLHPWFYSARRALVRGEDSPYLDYYNFTTEPRGGTYYPNGMPEGVYYEAHFWDQMPDLNMDSPAVREEIAKIAEFWLEKGVDGFRLDAAMWIYENDEQKNISFWDWFREVCREVDPDAYLIGEVWAGSDTVLNYYEAFDSCFDYPFAGQERNGIAAAANAGPVRYLNALEGYLSALKQKSTQGIAAPFLSNHDNNRTGGYLPTDDFSLQMAASIQLLSPGNPFIYYGEELGMKGSGKDENKRTKMLWGDGDTVTSPTGADYKNQIESTVEKQLADSASVLWHYRELLKIRNANPALARGQMKVLALDAGDAVGGYSVTYGDTVLYVLHNTAPEQKSVSLKASEIRGFVGQSGAPKLSGETVTLPARSSLVLAAKQ